MSREDNIDSDQLVKDTILNDPMAWLEALAQSVGTQPPSPTPPKAGHPKVKKVTVQKRKS